MRLDPSFLKSKYDHKDNMKYNQGLGGFLNTSFQGLPAYISKNHFLDAPENWSKLVEVYDETGQYHQTAN